MAAPGLITIESAFGPEETMDRLAAAVVARGMAVLSRIDHAGAAAEAALTLRPTAVLAFGNARAGTPLMQSVQTIGIDLPLRALVWRDEGGTTRISYNDPRWLAARHDVSGHEAVLAAMAATLAGVAAEAAGRPPSPP